MGWKVATKEFTDYNLAGEITTLTSNHIPHQPCGQFHYIQPTLYFAGRRLIHHSDAFVSLARDIHIRNSFSSSSQPPRFSVIQFHNGAQSHSWDVALSGCAIVVLASSLSRSALADIIAAVEFDALVAERAPMTVAAPADNIANTPRIIPPQIYTILFVMFVRELRKNDRR